VKAWLVGNCEGEYCFKRPVEDEHAWRKSTLHTARARTCGNSSGLFHGIKNHFTKAVTRMCTRGALGSPLALCGLKHVKKMLYSPFDLNGNAINRLLFTGAAPMAPLCLLPCSGA
jgi:hypothetical protein